MNQRIAHIAPVIGNLVKRDHNPVRRILDIYDRHSERRPLRLYTERVKGRMNDTLSRVFPM